MGAFKRVKKHRYNKKLKNKFSRFLDFKKIIVILIQSYRQ